MILLFNRLILNRTNISFVKVILKKFAWILTGILIVSLVSAQGNKIDSLKSATSKLAGIELVENQLAIAQEYLYIDPVQSIAFSKNALEISKKNKLKEEEAKSHMFLGSGLFNKGEFEEGRKEIELGLKLCANFDNPLLNCQGLNAMAVYYMNVGDYEKTLESFNSSLEIAEENNFEDVAAKLRFNLGSLYTNQGKYIKGLVHFQNALKYFHASDDKGLIASIFNNIAVNYHSWNSLDRALENYKYAANIYKELKNPNGESTALNNVGEIYKDKKDYPEAIKYFKRSLELAEMGENQVLKAVPMIGLAEVYLNTKESGSAQNYVEPAEKIFREFNFMEGIARSVFIRAGIELQKANYETSEELFMEALSMTNSIGIKELESDIYKQLSKLKNRTRDFKRALIYSNRHYSIEDSLLNVFNGEQLNEILAQMEVSQKATEISMLQKNNAIMDLEIKRKTLQAKYLVFSVLFLVVFVAVVLYLIKQKNNAYQIVDAKNQQIQEQHDQLVVANDTKDKFLSIIGHDLLSPVGAIRDVIIQLADYPEMFTNEERMSIITDMRLEADSTYFLLTNLLSWAKNQSDTGEPNLKVCNLSKIVNHNLSLHKRNAELKSISIDSSIDLEQTVYCDQNMIGLIIRNLVSNAIKFTPQGGEIKIVAKNQKGFVELCVIDSGIGISKENQAKLFSNEHISTYGTNKEKGTGLGLVLCREFIEKNGGELFLKSTSDKGSTFCFRVPGILT